MSWKNDIYTHMQIKSLVEKTNLVSLKTKNLMLERLNRYIDHEHIISNGRLYMDVMFNKSTSVKLSSQIMNLIINSNIDLNINNPVNEMMLAVEAINRHLNKKDRMFLNKLIIRYYNKMNYIRTFKESNNCVDYTAVSKYIVYILELNQDIEDVKYVLDMYNDEYIDIELKKILFNIALNNDETNIYEKINILSAYIINKKVVN